MDCGATCEISNTYFDKKLNTLTMVSEIDIITQTETDLDNILNDIIPDSWIPLSTYKSLYLELLHGCTGVLKKDGVIVKNHVMGSDELIWACGKTCKCIKHFGSNSPIAIKSWIFTTPKVLGIPVIMTEMVIGCVGRDV